MKIQVEAVSPIEKKVTVEIDAAQVAKEVERAYIGLGRRVRLPGFRPGKVPRNVLVRTFPRDYRGVEVTHAPAVVTDAMVEEELQKLRESASTLKPVEGRDVAEKGDWATIDHEGTIDGKPFAGATAQGVTVRVQEGPLEEGNFAQLDGKKIGETVEFDHAFAADYRMPEAAGKTARFKVVIKGLKTRQAPVLDDEFARLVGILGVETVDQLRARMRADIEKREK